MTSDKDDKQNREVSEALSGSDCSVNCFTESDKLTGSCVTVTYKDGTVKHLCLQESPGARFIYRQEVADTVSSELITDDWTITVGNRNREEEEGEGVRKCLDPEDRSYDNFIKPIICGWKIDNYKSLSNGSLAGVIAALKKADESSEMVEISLTKETIKFTGKYDGQTVEISLGHNPVLFDMLVLQAFILVKCGIGPKS